jgi:hypothetical protein
MGEQQGSMRLTSTAVKKNLFWCKAGSKTGRNITKDKLMRNELESEVVA